MSNGHIKINEKRSSSFRKEDFRLSLILIYIYIYIYTHLSIYLSLSLYLSIYTYTELGLKLMIQGVLITKKLRHLGYTISYWLQYFTCSYIN